MTQTLRKNLGKRNPWSGWSKEKPGFHQRTFMFKKCGKKCFLGSKKTFPICKKNTCKVSKKGVYAAYVRARQYHRNSVSVKAKKMIKRMFKH